MIKGGEIRKWAFDRLLMYAKNPFSLDQIVEGRLPITPGFVTIPEPIKYYQGRRLIPEPLLRILYYSAPPDRLVPFTIMRKWLVNCKGRLIQENNCPEYLREMPIAVLPEGFVFGVKSGSDLYLPSDEECYSQYFDIHIVNSGNCKIVYLKRKSNVSPPPLPSEIVNRIAMTSEFLSLGHSYRIVHEQLKIFEASPFYSYLIWGSQVLARAYEVAKPALSERLELTYCADCQVAYDWQDIILKNQKFNKSRGINSNEEGSLIAPSVGQCWAGGPCYVDMLQVYRSYVGHVKQKLISYEKANDTKCYDYVETKLQYYFLQSIFQLASVVIRPTFEYRQRVLEKLEEYENNIRYIDFNDNPPKQDFVIKPSEAGEFTLALRKLLDSLESFISFPTSQNGSNLQEVILSFRKYQPFSKLYGLVIDSVVSFPKTYEDHRSLLDKQEVTTTSSVNERSLKDAQALYREVRELEKNIVITRPQVRFEIILNMLEIAAGNLMKTVRTKEILRKFRNFPKSTVFATFKYLREFKPTIVKPHPYFNDPNVVQFTPEGINKLKEELEIREKVLGLRGSNSTYDELELRRLQAFRKLLEKFK